MISNCGICLVKLLSSPTYHNSIFSIYVWSFDCFSGSSATDCAEDEFDAGYATCLKIQTGINPLTCPLDEDHPPPGRVAQCVGGTGWNYIHVGGMDAILNCWFLGSLNVTSYNSSYIWILIQTHVYGLKDFESIHESNSSKILINKCNIWTLANGW